MAEFLTMSEAQDKFGTKGKANTALGLGIAGLATAVLNGGLSGLFGGGSTPVAAECAAINADSQACAFVSKDTFWQQNVGLEKELGVQRYDNLKANYELYINLDKKISALQSKNAALEASLPLAMQLAAVNAERYADNKVFSAVEAQNGMNFMFQREIDRRIVGTLGLPWGDIITGIPRMPNCTIGVTCPSGSTPA